MSKKKHHEEEHENHERWLVSWADMMTLLFALFVVLYAVGKVDKDKLEQTSRSLKVALKYNLPDDPNGVEVTLMGPPCEADDCVLFAGEPDPRLAEQIRRRLEDLLRPWLREQPDPPVAITELEGKRLVVRLSAGHFFDTGTAALHPEALPILDAVAGELRKLDRRIRIEGHTDDRPIRTERFRNNWDLSAARAATVVAYMEQAHQIPSERLAAVGFAATRPLASNDTESGRVANRRIDLIVETEPRDVLDGAAW